MGWEKGQEGWMGVPESQWAVQLTGSDELVLNREKAVFGPGRTQMLLQVEAVGLCFSDLKLLKQFSKHARKGEVCSGVEPGVLGEIPSYVPGEKPAVPGHEAVGRIVAVGDGVRRHRMGERVLVQADWRFLKTAQSNGSFGYNFEGGLQEYTLLDERLVIDPDSGERFLVPVGEERSASALALVEPWGCVEDSYVARERRRVKKGGQTLVVVEEGLGAAGLEVALKEGSPGEVKRAEVSAIGGLPDRAFDDVLYYGSDAAVVEALGEKLANGGLMNVVQCGERFGRPVSVDVGRVHYGGTRWCGTAGEDARMSYAGIPESGELREGEKVLIVGAGGPMGQMHVIRCVSSGVKGLEVVGSDMDAGRLGHLESKVKGLAERNGVSLSLVEAGSGRASEAFTTTILMAPVAGLVVEAVKKSARGGRINIFAGIAAGTRAELELEGYLGRGLWMFGTSGSTIADIKAVLAKVERGTLDTNYSVGAVSGMAGAIEGIRAVEHRRVAGKIVVYPGLHELGLVKLEEMGERCPAAGKKLKEGNWTQEAEAALMGR